MASKGKSPASVVREIKRKTRRVFNAEEKIRIILEGLRGEDAIAKICRRESIHLTQYYKWSKEFLKAGKRRFNGDIIREAASPLLFFKQRFVKCAQNIVRHLLTRCKSCAKTA